MAPSTAGCSAGSSSRGVPRSAAAGKRQEACGGAELSVSKGHVAHTSGLSEAPATSNEVAVISRGLGGCRAERERSCLHAWERAMPVPWPPATAGTRPPRGVAQPGCACCTPTMGTWNQKMWWDTEARVLDSTFPVWVMFKHSPRNKSIAASRCRVHRA